MIEPKDVSNLSLNNALADLDFVARVRDSVHHLLKRTVIIETETETELDQEAEVDLEMAVSWRM